jgi:hypothetical protein
MQALRSTSKTILTSELTKMLTKIAFQQWKITIQDKIIKEAQLNITQATAAITKQQTPTASVSNSLTLDTTKPSSTIAATVTATGTTATKVEVSTNNTTEINNKFFVSATVAESHPIMAYAATTNAHALTNGVSPFANARATTPKAVTFSSITKSYKEALQTNICNSIHDTFNTSKQPPTALTTTSTAATAIPIISTRSQTTTPTSNQSTKTLQIAKTVTTVKSPRKTAANAVAA